ncbi:MAG: polyprenyl synthetase family protein [Phycisphaerales bacterium]
MAPLVAKTPDSMRRPGLAALLGIAEATSARSVGVALEGHPLVPLLGIGLSRVVERFDRQLETPLAHVAELLRHVEKYRGKMLRPTVTLLSGLACDPRGCVPEAVTDPLITVAAVVEMIHVATLVHDDVLDEADIRRGHRTINAWRGNEAAVMLGDYLIARSFHLCSQLDEQKTALRVGEVTAVVAEGEMLQLAHRGDFSLGERTYYEIVERKTAALIAAACELGARHAGADEATQRRLSDYGRLVGVAFQIQDDLLDLVGEEDIVGKSLGKDLDNQKLTLPLIHHLGVLPPAARLEAERMIHSRAFDQARRHALHPRLVATDSITYARAAAQRLVNQAKESLSGLPETPARATLLAMADAVITRQL